MTSAEVPHMRLERVIEFGEPIIELAGWAELPVVRVNGTAIIDASRSRWGGLCGYGGRGQ